MRNLALLFTAVLLSGCGTAYAPSEFDFSQLDRGRSGVVERVAHADIGERRVVVRLDNGFALEACADGEGLEPGERVRILTQQQGGVRAARE